LGPGVVLLIAELCRGYRCGLRPVGAIGAYAPEGMGKDEETPKGGRLGDGGRGGWGDWGKKGDWELMKKNEHPPAMRSALG
jgi:hypothetical protein